MINNLKHIDPSFLNQELFKKTKNLNDWLTKADVSSKSKFYDNIWLFDGCELYSNSVKSINWERKTNSGFFLLEYPEILDTFKKVIYFLKTTISGNQKRKTISQTQTYYSFMYLIDWMLINKIYSFNQFSHDNFNKYSSWLKKDKIKLKNKSSYLYPIKYLYEFREYLIDSIETDYFDGIPISKWTDYNRKDKKQTEAIPNEILEIICKKILPIIDYFYDSNITLENITDQKIIVKPNIKNSKNTEDNKKENIVGTLNAIAYFIIGLYAGMRVSEIMGLKKNSLEIDENNVLVLNSNLFKLVQGDKGRPEKWGCGVNNENNYALKVFKVLTNLTPDSYQKLFFRFQQGIIKDFPLSSMNIQLNSLMEICDLDWKISTHQLRRTFAKLIGISDNTCLVALKEHFKHASIAMTDYYVGTNLELISMISEEKQQEISQGLESMLSSDKLAGKLGEKITKLNLKFRGNIELRKEYINQLLTNSDLIVIPHEYGFCIYQPEQAKCRGESRNIGLNTCTKCNNFVVLPKHKTFWINRVEEYEKFTEQIATLPNQQASLEELTLEISEANRIINKI